MTTHAQFLLYKGDSWRFDATLHDNAGAALNLTDAEIVWNLRDASGSIVIALAISNGVEIIDAAAGTCRVTVSPEATAALAEGSYADEVIATIDDFVCTQSVGPIKVAQPRGVAQPDLQAELMALKKARHSGIRRLRIENVEREFRSDGELRAAISALESEIAGAASSRTIYPRSKGWS
jgi:hypothetical protein